MKKREITLAALKVAVVGGLVATTGVLLIDETHRQLERGLWNEELMAQWNEQFDDARREAKNNPVREKNAEERTYDENSGTAEAPASNSGAEFCRSIYEPGYGDRQVNQIPEHGDKYRCIEVNGRPAWEVR